MLHQFLFRFASEVKYFHTNNKIWIDFSRTFHVIAVWSSRSRRTRGALKYLIFIDQFLIKPWKFSHLSKFEKFCLKIAIYYYFGNTLKMFRSRTQRHINKPSLIRLIQRMLFCNGSKLLAWNWYSYFLKLWTKCDYLVHCKQKVIILLIANKNLWPGLCKKENYKFQYDSEKPLSVEPWIYYIPTTKLKGPVRQLDLIWTLIRTLIPHEHSLVTITGCLKNYLDLSEPGKSRALE